MPNYYPNRESKYQTTAKKLSELSDLEKPMVVEISANSTIKYVNIQSLIQSHLEYTGKVSGRQYTWNKAGDVTPVLEEDSAELLAKRLGAKTCCGNEENKIFQLVS